MISDRLLVDDAYYWLNAPAIDSDDPVMIGQYSKPRHRWYISGQLYNGGVGIEAIRRIHKPKIKSRKRGLAPVCYV
jgi:hypothetical protein